jgi:hypothetical protein
MHSRAFHVRGWGTRPCHTARRTVSTAYLASHTGRGRGYDAMNLDREPRINSMRETAHINSASPLLKAAAEQDVSRCSAR